MSILWLVCLIYYQYNKPAKMLQRLKSISDENSPNLIHFIFARMIKTMKSTTKADKLARLFANIIKLIRTATP